VAFGVWGVAGADRLRNRNGRDAPVGAPVAIWFQGRGRRSQLGAPPLSLFCRSGSITVQRHHTVVKVHRTACPAAIFGLDMLGPARHDRYRQLVGDMVVSCLTTPASDPMAPPGLSGWR